MPTYEYVCERCGHEFERSQSISAGAMRKCPRCGKAGLRRLIGTGAGVIFKGSGFYETDYRSESYKKSAEKDKSGGRKDEQKDTSRKDDKIASKESKSASKADSGKSEKKKSA